MFMPCLHAISQIRSEYIDSTILIPVEHHKATKYSWKHTRQSEPPDFYYSNTIGTKTKKCLEFPIAGTYDPTKFYG